MKFYINWGHSLLVDLKNKNTLMVWSSSSSSLYFGNPSSLGNIPQVSGLSLPDISQPHSHGGSEGRREGAGSAVGAWGGVLFHKRIADGKTLLLWISVLERGTRSLVLMSRVWFRVKFGVPSLGLVSNRSPTNSNIKCEETIGASLLQHSG